MVIIAILSWIPVIAFLRWFCNVLENVILGTNERKCVEKTDHIYYEPFSLTEYFDRIEKAYTEILEQKERQSNSEEYAIILWWGLDGLRLNKGGSSEWISKRKEESTKREQVLAIRKSVKYRGEARTLFELCSMQANIGDMVYVHETALMYAYSGDGSWSPVYRSSACNTSQQLQQCFCTMDYINSLQAQCTQSTQSRILELQEQNQQLQFQLTQSEQNRRIVESIQGGKGNQQIINIGFRYQ